MKKLSVALLALTMVASVCACAQSGKPAAASSAAPAADATTPASTVTPAPASINWPGNDTITVVVPYGAGGDTDFNTRVMFEKVQERLGGKFIVQNVAGNSGAVGAQSVLEAEPDGKTLLTYHTAMLINQATGLTDFGFDDFDMCAIFADKDNGCYFMRTDNPYGIKSFPELVEYTKANPGKLTLTYQVGGTSHLGALHMLKSGADCSLVDVGGKSECLAALLGAQVDVTNLTYAAAKEYVDNGEFFALGYFGSAENPLIDPAKYPALNQYGVNYNWPMDYCVAFPKGTDPAINKLLADTIADIVANDADYAKQIADAYYQVPTSYNTAETVKIYSDLYTELGEYVEELKGN